MSGRYSYFRPTNYIDISTKGEYAPITNPTSLTNVLSGSLFKNPDSYPDPLSYNYTAVEFRYEPNKLSIDEITLNLFYMIPYVLYISKNNTENNLQNISTEQKSIYDKEDILLDINNIPHIDTLFDLDEEGTEYIITPKKTDWNNFLGYLENTRRGIA